MRNRAENQITLVLLRHGATQANEGHRYLGKTDEALSERGKKTLTAYKEELFKSEYRKVEYLFVSPMKRCRETGEILYPDVPGIVIPEWSEMDFGEFEYKNYEELKEDKRYQAWIDSNGTLPFPGGESREAFCLRCVKGFQRMSRELGQIEKRDGLRPETIGGIVHGGTIMALLSTYCGGNYFEYQVPNGGGYICTMKVQGCQLEWTEIKRIPGRKIR